MALIGKIRRNLWFVLILLGLALAAFVIMDMTSASNLGGATEMTMGEVNGDKIDYREFQTAESVLYSGSSGNVFANRNQLWNYFVENAIINQESEKLGLGVGFEELQELQFGQNLSPIIQQSFSNPQTRQVDRAQLNQIQQAIQNDDLNPQFKAYWREQEKQIIKARLQDKLNSLVSKSMYSPTWMAEQKHSSSNDNADIAFVKIPFDEIEDSDIEVTDSDFANYIDKHAAEFTTTEESRDIKYLVFDVLPSETDSLLCREQMDSLKVRFKNAFNDSTFALNNNGLYTFIYSEKEQLPEDIRDEVSSMNVGEVAGPFIQGSSLRSYKLVDARVIPDSVKARHILRRAEPNNRLALTQAEELIDSLLTVLKNREATFDSLAIKFSDDTGSKLKGGDLGTFVQGTMVPPFNNACFVHGKRGDYKVVQTQFGVHLIHIQNQKFLNRNKKYKVAYVDVPIVPSKETQDAVYDQVYDLASRNSGIESLENELAEAEDLEFESANSILANDFSLANLGSGQTSRDIIRWVFDPGTDPGDLSADIFSYTDPVNYYDNKYVLAGLDKIVSPGKKSVEQVRNDIHPIIVNKKKAEKLAGELSNQDLEVIANQYNTNVDTARAVSFSSNNIPGIGPESKVIGAIFNMNQDEVSAPIVGESGIYILKLLSKTSNDAPANIAQIRSFESMSNRGAVSFQLMESLKKYAKISDKRSSFF